jgi:DNA-binding phage protein
VPQAEGARTLAFLRAFLEQADGLIEHARQYLARFGGVAGTARSGIK